MLAYGDHEPEIGPDHAVLGLQIIVIDHSPPQLLLFLRSQERRAVDLLQEVADERMVRSRGEPPIDEKARTQVRIAAPLAGKEGETIVGLWLA